VRFSNTSLVLEYLRKERPEGWHAMMLASLPAVAQGELKDKKLTAWEEEHERGVGVAASPEGEGRGEDRGKGEGEREVRGGGASQKAAHEQQDGTMVFSPRDMIKVLAGNDEELKATMAKIRRMSALKTARHTPRKRQSV